MKQLLLIVSCYWMLLIETCSSYRILFIPIQQMSHIESMILIGEELGGRSHESYIMLMENFKSDKLRPLTNSSKGLANVNWFHAPTPIDDGRTVEEHMDEFSQKLLKFSHSPRDLANLVASQHSSYCEDKLRRIDELFDEIVELKLDLVVVDITFLSKCFLLIPHRLGIPWVTYTDYPDLLGMRFPWLPSIVPHHFSKYSDSMNIWQRFINSIITIVVPMLAPKFPVSLDLQRKYDKNLSISSFDELTRKSSLFLLTSHPLLDYPKPLMPNMIQVGGLTVRPAKSLPMWLESFVDRSSSKGTILVSMGSMFAVLPDEMIKRFVDAFEQLGEYRILWRLKGSPGLTLPRNVMTLEWLPQIDVLGHPKTKLFITHCGNNGQFEAMYNRIPMIGMPIFGDQIYNAQRMQNKGFGIVMDVSTFTANDLVSTVRRILSDSGFKSRISPVSEAFRDSLESPVQLSARWLERVLRHGSDFYESAGNSLDLYEYWMIDIVVMLLVLIALFTCLTFMIITFSLRILYKFIIRRNSSCEGDLKKKIN